jgi:hypothetical protein
LLVCACRVGGATIADSALAPESRAAVRDDPLELFGVGCLDGAAGLSPLVRCGGRMGAVANRESQRHVGAGPKVMNVGFAPPPLSVVRNSLTTADQFPAVSTPA